MSQIIGPIILTRFQVESLEEESKQVVAIEFLIYFITLYYNVQYTTPRGRVKGMGF